jgi:hypothetical protein
VLLLFIETFLRFTGCGDPSIQPSAYSGRTGIFINLKKTVRPE